MKKEILFTFVQGCNAWDVLSVQYPKKNAQLGELDEEKGEIHLSSILFKPGKEDLLRQTFLHELTHLATASITNSLRQNEAGHLEVSPQIIDELVAEQVGRVFAEVLRQIPPQFLKTLIGI